MTQGERLVAIETKLEDINYSIEEIKTSLKDHMEWEDKKYNDLKSDFAAKWAEKAVWFLIAALAGIALKVMVGGI